MGRGMAFPFAPRFKREHLWAAGVAAVICGDFVAWQPAFAQGTGCALLSFFVAALLYMLLVCSLNEVMSRMGEAEGPSQVAACIGPRTSFLAGVMECLKCVLIMADIAAAMGAFLQELTGSASAFQPLWWLLLSTAVLLLNTKLTSISLPALLLLTLSACIIVVSYFLFTSARTFEMAKRHISGDEMLQKVTVLSFFKSMPAGMWCFLGVEEMLWFGKFAADARTNVPRALTWSYVTLFILGMLTMITSMAASPGMHFTTSMKFPLLLAYFDVFGDSSVSRYFAMLLLFGMIASLHTFMWVSGQLVTQMAEDSLFPACLAQRNEQTGTPTYSSAVCIAMALVLLEVVFQALGHQYEEVRSIFTCAASVCALGGYFIQLSCFLLLRWRAEAEDSLMMSPFGSLGAGFAMVLTLVFLVSVLASPIFNPQNLCGVLLSLVVLLLASCVHECNRQQMRKMPRSSTRLPEETEGSTSETSAADA